MKTFKNRHWKLAFTATMVVGGMWQASARAALTYWDVNDVSSGSGGPTPVGTWDLALNNWNTDSTGAALGAIGPWVAGDDAVFSAGTDATGAYAVTITGTQTAGSILIKNGTAQFVGGTASSAGATTVNSGAVLSIDTSGRLAGTGAIVLNGGTFVNTNPGSAGTFTTKDIQLGALGGTLSHATTGTSTVTLYTGKITGAGATLTKVGPQELRVQNVNTASYNFAKLVVNEGLYRLGSVTTGTPAVQQTSELGYGAAPATFTADAITLNGGSIGASFSVTLNANRGITLGPNGGGFNAAGGMTIPGAITGSSVLTTVGTAGITLSSPSNNTTFTGSLVVNGALTLAESLTVKNITGTANTSVSTGKTLTAGGDNTDFTYSGTVTGAGTFTKVGTGTLTNMTNWTNSGATNINAGTMKFGVSAAGFGTNSAVTIAPGATFDMNNINDTFGSLVGGGSIINGLNISLSGPTPANAAYVATFTGSYVGAGAFTKNGTFIQQFTKANPFTSALIANGAINIGDSGSLGAGTITVNSAATDFVSIGPAVVLTNNMLLGGSATKYYATAGNSLTLNGVINNSGAAAGGISVANTAGGTLAVNGANLFSGPVTVTAGTLKIGSPTALGFGGNHKAANGTTVATGAVVDLNGNAGINETFSLNGTGIGGAGALINSNTTTAATVSSGIAAVNLTSGGAGGLSAPPTVTITGGGGTGATAVATLGVTAASFTINPGGQIYTVAPTVVISGSGVAVAQLDATGLMVGVTISNPGFNYTTAPTITISGGTFTGTGAPTGVGNADNFQVGGIAITDPGNGYTSTPTITVADAVVTPVLTSVTLATATSVGGAGDINVDAVITGGPTASLTKVGTGKLTLSAANTYTGATIVSAGRLAISAANRVPDASALTVDAGATFDLTNGGTGNFNETVGSLAGAGSVVIGSATITVGGDNTSTAFSGTVSGAGGGLTKTGTGTLTVTGTQTYTGSTSVTGGTLDASGATITPSAGPMTVTGSGSQLKAAKIAPSSLTVGAGAKVTLTNVDTDLDRSGRSTVGTWDNSGLVDLGKTGVVISTATEATILAQILSARGSGPTATWTGTTGITSSNAAANPTNRGIGYVVAGNQITVAQTVLGDANLDDVVNIDDLSILAQNYNLAGTNWQRGDYNFDGTVNIDDLSILAQNYNLTSTDTPSPEASARAFAADFPIVFGALSVPEPGSLGLLALGGLGLLVRRRRPAIK